MKKTISLFLTCASLSVSAQLKLFPGGLQSYGSSTSPANGEKHKFTGDIVISSSAAPTGSAIRLRGNNGYSSASTPDYTWLGNDQTGLFHPASNVIGFTTGGTERARLSSSGSLLMGTTSVENALANFVVGTGGAIYAQSIFTADWQDPTIEVETNRANSATFQSKLSGTATCYISGTGWIYAAGTYVGSDRNIKDDIHTIDSAGSKLNRLKGITYRLKKEKQNPALYGNPAEYMGVIAQDVELVAPQAVKTLPDGTKAVSYEMLVGLLIEGFKEQSAKVTQLESALNACCSKNSDGGTKRLTTSSATGDSDTPDGTSYLKQNRPNPFNKETVIEYNVIEQGTAGILVFDMNGRLLKTLPVKIPGKGSISINASDFEPGMYYYTLIVNDKEVDTKKMILTQ